LLVIAREWRVPTASSKALTAIMDSQPERRRRARAQTPPQIMVLRK
jgi:hypothetical protein